MKFLTSTGRSIFLILLLGLEPAGAAIEDAVTGENGECAELMESLQRNEFGFPNGLVDSERPAVVGGGLCPGIVDKNGCAVLMWGDGTVGETQIIEDGPVDGETNRPSENGSGKGRGH